MLTPSTILTAGVGAKAESTSGESAKDGAIVIGTAIAAGVTIGVNATVTAAMTESRPEVDPPGAHVGIRLSQIREAQQLAEKTTLVTRKRLDIIRTLGICLP